MSQTSLPQKYWNMFFEFKVAEYYYQLYSLHAKKQRDFLSGLTTIGSAAFILSWYQTEVFPLLWGSLILVAQILTALQPYLPFEKRLTAACYICSDLIHLNLEIELEWDNFSNDSSDEEYKDKTTYFRTEYARIEERFADSETFPKNKRIFKEAQKDDQIYFRRF